MLSTIFLLFMSGWMLAVVLQNGMAALPVVVLLTAMMVSIRLLQNPSITRKQAHVHLPGKAEMKQLRSPTFPFQGRRPYVSNVEQ
jgi:hypothetical protein